MRKKPNLIPRMERCAAVLVQEPEAHFGRWREDFPGFAALYLELGCGKGRFTAEMAAQNPDVLFVAVERVPDAMVVAMERVCAAGLTNVRFVDMDASRLPAVFGCGEVSRVYVNFCDPWPKSRDAKHRLTAPGFLREYARVLPDGGEVHFKTDNAPLFDWSLEQFASGGWLLRGVTRDLHGNGPGGAMTDYEAKFHAQGVPICRLEAERTPETKTPDDALPRLRNAGLPDARGCNGREEAVQDV